MATAISEVVVTFERLIPTLHQLPHLLGKNRSNERILSQRRGQLRGYAGRAKWYRQMCKLYERREIIVANVGNTLQAPPMVSTDAEDDFVSILQAEWDGWISD